MDFTEEWEGSCSSVGKAVKGGDLKLLRKLIREGGAVDVADNRGWRPLHEAAVIRRPDAHLLLEEILKHEDCDPNWQSHEGETGLLLACKRNLEETAYKVIEMLLRYKSDPNITDNEEETPLLAASRSGMTSVVRLLSSHQCVAINKGDFGGWTPLHEATTRGNLEMMQCLLKYGANLAEKDECGMTPIFSASQHGRVDSLGILINEAILKDQKYLIDEGANDGASPLMIAAQQGFTDCVNLLIESGADVDKCANDGVNALHLAAECGKPETVEVLMKCMDIPKMAQLLRPELDYLEMRNPLHLAINSGKKQSVEIMLKNGFPVDSVDHIFEQKFSLSMPSPKFLTGLGLVVSLNLLDLAQLLLRFGANVNSLHTNVYAPLHCVFSVIDYEYERDENLDILRFLLENGADPNYCRTSAEPSELLHSLFKPNHLKLLLEYGFDTKSCFKEGYIGRFLALSLHTLSLDWYHKVLKDVVNYLERDRIVQDHFVALSQHIETAYRQRFGLQKYDSKMWSSVISSFDVPHNLKETCRLSLRKRLLVMARKSGKQFPHLIELLDVPVCLKEYLLFRVLE